MLFLEATFWAFDDFFYFKVQLFLLTHLITA